MPGIFGPTPAEIQGAIRQQQQGQAAQILATRGPAAFSGFQGGNAFNNALSRFAGIVDPRVARAEQLHQIQNQVRQRTQGAGIGEQLKTTAQLLQANGFFEEAVQAEQLMLEMEKSGVDLTKSQFQLREAQSKAVLKERELARELGMIPATDKEKAELAKIEAEIKQLKARTGELKAKTRNAINKQAFDREKERRKNLDATRKENRSQLNTLRDDFRQDSKVLRSALDSFDTVIATSSGGPGLIGISDTALIFAYAKILDPISTVRESEFETIQRGGRNLPETIQDDLRKLFGSGTRLSDNARTSIVNEVKKVMRERVNRFRDTTLKSYAKDAAKIGANLEDITRGLGEIPEGSLELEPLDESAQTFPLPDQGVPLEFSIGPDGELQ